MMDVSCQYAYDLMMHGREVLRRRGDLKLIKKCGIDEFPRYERGSTLEYCQPIRVYCVFPVPEWREVDVSTYDVHRPIYYCELIASKYVMAKNRRKIRKRKKKLI